MTNKDDLDIEEGEVITYHDLRSVYDDDNNDKDLKRIKLECMNCGQIGTVYGMRQKKNLDKNNKGVPLSPSGDKDKKWLPSTKKYKWIAQNCQSDESKSKALSTQQIKDCIAQTKGKKDDDKDYFSKMGLRKSYKEYFECPNCGSTAIALAEGELDRVIADAI